MMGRAVSGRWTGVPQGDARRTVGQDPTPLGPPLLRASPHFSLLLLSPLTEHCVFVAQSCPTLCDPLGCHTRLQAPLSMEFSRQEYWSG